MVNFCARNKHLETEESIEDTL